MSNKNFQISLIIILAVLTSCGPKIRSQITDNSDRREIYDKAYSNPPEIDVAIDLVYKTILDTEIEEVGRKIYIVDKSMGKSMTDATGYEFIKNDSISSFTWNKNIYKTAKYLDHTLISDYKNNHPDKYFGLAHMLTVDEWSMYELWIPSFTEDRKTAIIEVFFNNSNFIHKNFYKRFAFVVEWKKGRYEKVKYIPIESSH